MPLEHYEVRFKNRDGKWITRQIEDGYGRYSLNLAMGNEHFSSLNEIPNFNEIAPFLREFSILSPISGKIDLSIFINIHKLSFHSYDCEIEGLEELNNLEYLDLSNTKFKKIDGLSHLKNLRRLNLSNANLDKIPTLGDLKKLERLDLSNNQISKIEGLEGLRKLYSLNLQHNQISRIKGLSKLRHLYQLLLSYNPISKIENLNGVNKPLKLRFKPIPKIENLYKLNSLRIISLSDTKINSIAGIESVSDLYSLNINNTDVSSLEPLKKFKKIEYICANNCPIRSLHGINTNPDLLKDVYINPKNLCPTGAQLYNTAISSHQPAEIQSRSEIIPLLEFYSISPAELAFQYINNPNNKSVNQLTPNETERLIHEATQKERTILENAVDTEILSQDDYILSQITARLSVDISVSPDLKILL